MPGTLHWGFGPFRLDPTTHSLWRDEVLVPLPPKPCAVLAYLVAHAGQVVTKERLFQAVWPATHVTESALTTCVGEIRQVLGETARAPQYIVTLPRRGYRFIAEVRTVAAAMEPPARRSPPTALPSTPRQEAGPAPLCVARETELGHLQQCLAAALRGERQVVLISGEAGIGKTTLVDAFVAQVTPTTALWIGRGQCLEQHGPGEPYLPLLEALGRLGRGPDGEQLVAVLRQQAPSWLLQLPALVPEDTYEVLRHRGGGATRERMLRELAEAVEVVTAVRPVVLVLEDLHWSDAATVDWLAYVARRREAARLLVLGTYRSTDARVQGHPIYPVAHELQRHGPGRALSLGYFSEAAVAVYLTQRFGTPQPAGLGRALHQRTTGNPLFVTTLVDLLVRQGRLQDAVTGGEVGRELEATLGGVPDSLRQLMEQQLMRLTPDVQVLLEAASVAGKEFAVAAVAAAVAQAVETVDEQCAILAHQGQFLRVSDTEVWPDGTVAERYGFVHDLYRETLYARVPGGRRRRWHRQIGRRLEAGYGPEARARAAELAAHFVHGLDPERAVQYSQYAGEQALQRSAHQEALGHLTKGLELLATLPEAPARAQQELDLQMALGPVLVATQGSTTLAVEQTYTRARALCAQVGETPQRFATLWGIWRFYQGRGTMSTARELGEQLLRLAEREADPMHRLEAHDALGTTLLFLGDYTAARTHLEQAIVLTDPAIPRARALRQGEASMVRCLAVAANTLWCVGAPTQATHRMQEALALVHELDHPYSLATAWYYTAFLHYRRRDAPMVQVQAESLLTLATTQGFPLSVGFGTCWRGWALAMQGEGAVGVEELRRGLEAIMAIGQEVSRPIFLVLLAEAAGHTGQIEDGLRWLTEALTVIERGRQEDLLAEAYRLQGTLLLHQAVPEVAQAEVCFQYSLAVARRQQAKSWELRAAMSLSRLWLQQGKRAEARALLAPINGWFTEGFDTPDLREASALLAALG